MHKTFLIAAAAATLAIPAIAQTTSPPDPARPAPMPGQSAAPEQDPEALPKPGATPQPAPTLDPSVDRNNNGVPDDRETPKPHHTPRA
ncbi:MAG: hypothetical protein DI623_10260 [Sphingomonas sanxanigenens]|uniref:Uncharacterized protein n=1 Tax=Sphingomonas sanxanigenens TaxID=397260 RepID=A0A2W5C5G2_9SPHN|nr:MAG: hypothetical protein DI623_10260 [Sphingomonas sanxanigenens]